MTAVVSIRELRQWIFQKKAILVDVREPFELRNGMIPTAHNVPLGQLSTALDLPAVDFKNQFEFPKPAKSDILVCYCRTGGRSAVAARIATSKGFNAYNFAGSVFEWSKSDPSVRFYGPAPLGR